VTCTVAVSAGPPASSREAADASLGSRAKGRTPELSAKSNTVAKISALTLWQDAPMPTVD